MIRVDAASVENAYRDWARVDRDLDRFIRAQVANERLIQQARSFSRMLEQLELLRVNVRRRR